jgi:hypothetical protein
LKSRGDADDSERPILKSEQLEMLMMDFSGALYWASCATDEKPDQTNRYAEVGFAWIEQRMKLSLRPSRWPACIAKSRNLMWLAMPMLTIHEPKLRSKINMNDIGSAARPESRSNYETYRVGDAIRP